MKCPKCNGYGYIDNLEGDGLKCPKCNGTGFIRTHKIVPWKRMEYDLCDGTGVVEPLTNEEWFNRLTTEEKAIAIVLCCPYEADWFGDNFEKRMEQRMKNLSHSAYGYEKGIQRINEWLKQPHNNNKE